MTHLWELKKRYKSLHQRLEHDHLLLSLSTYGPRQKSQQQFSTQGMLCTLPSKTTDGFVPESVTYQEEERGAGEVQQQPIPRHTRNATNNRRQPHRSAKSHRRVSRIRNNTLLERILGTCIFYLTKLNVPTLKRQ